MRTITYEHVGPTGKVLINIPEKGVLYWYDFICNLTFHKEGLYEERIQQMSDVYGNDDNKLLLIVSDVSKHPYLKRVCVRVIDIKQNENE